MRRGTRTRADKSQGQVVDALRAAGAAVYVIGLPLDLLVCWHGRTFLMEVKEEGGKLSDTQEKFIRGWPGEVRVVRGLREALGCIGVSVL